MRKLTWLPSQLVGTSAPVLQWQHGEVVGRNALEVRPAGHLHSDCGECRLAPTQTSPYIPWLLHNRKINNMQKCLSCPREEVTCSCPNAAKDYKQIDAIFNIHMHIYVFMHEQVLAQNIYIIAPHGFL